MTTVQAQLDLSTMTYIQVLQSLIRPSNVMNIDTGNFHLPHTKFFMLILQFFSF